MSRIVRRSLGGLGITMGLALFVAPPAHDRPPPWMNARLRPAARAHALRLELTPDEKLALVASGKAGIPRLGVPPLAFIDGPNGVGHANTHVTAFPNAVNVAAAWDRRLARRYGEALGAETTGKGHTLLAAPTINIVRTPKWGRERGDVQRRPVPRRGHGGRRDSAASRAST